MLHPLMFFVIIQFILEHSLTVCIKDSLNIILAFDCITPSCNQYDSDPQKAKICRIFF